MILLILGSFAYLSYRHFKLAVLVLLALLPTYLIRFSVGPIPTTLLECLILVTVGFWLLKEKGWKLDFLRTLGPLRAPILLFLAAACFGVAVAPDTFAALGLWKAYVIEPLLLFFVLRSTFTKRADWEQALLALGWAVVFLAVFAVVQRFTGIGIPSPWDLELRATSVFEYPNALGLFVAPIVSAFVVLAGCKTTSQRLRIFHGSVAVLGVIACVLSQTEAALVAIPVALLVALALSTVPTKIKIGLLSLAIVLGAGVIGVSSTIREKIFLQDLSGQVRLSQWRETSELLRDKPMLGAGLSGYPTEIKPYHDPRLYEIFQYPHNVFLNIWVEFGVLGLIALLLGIIAVCRITWQHREDTFVLAAGTALLTMLIHGLVDVPFLKNDLAVLTVFFLALTVFVPSPVVRKP